MLELLYKIKIKLRDWVLVHSNGRHAKLWLAGLSFAEASFFPIPPDVFLVAIISARQNQKWLYYSIITIISSIVGGMFGYLIGVWFFDSIGYALISFYGLEESVKIVKELFLDNAFWAVFIAGFTPIPYKVFTISAGFFGVNFIVFIVASTLSRALRFLSVGYIMKVFGENMGRFVFKYFNMLTFLFAILIVVLIIILKR
jgi:membrane protein YqaA with SNARE-associated domain